jgi:hypothetical protein
VLLGRVVSGDGTTPSARRLLVIVDGTPQVVPLAPDGSFQVRDVPTGELMVKAELDDVPGVAVIDEVDDGELLEISITPSRDNLAIALTRRAELAATPARHGPRLEARGKDVVYRLEPGVHEGSMTVLGDGITVLGAHEGEACDDAHRTVLLGDLVVEGEGNVVYDVAVRGEVIAKGKGVRVFDSCSGAYFGDATLHGGLTGWRSAGARTRPFGAAKAPRHASSRAKDHEGTALRTGSRGRPCGQGLRSRPVLAHTLSRRHGQRRLKASSGCPYETFLVNLHSHDLLRHTRRRWLRACL